MGPSASTLCIFLLLTGCLANQSHVGNKVAGDQSVGGIHLFELHAPGGGIGLGIKVLLIGAIVVAILYWYMRRQTIRAIRRTAVTAAPALGTELAEVVAHRAAPRATCGSYCRRAHDDDEAIPRSHGVRLP